MECYCKLYKSPCKVAKQINISFCFESSEIFLTAVAVLETSTNLQSYQSLKTILRRLIQNPVKHLRRSVIRNYIYLNIYYYRKVYTVELFYGHGYSKGNFFDSPPTTFSKFPSKF